MTTTPDFRALCAELLQPLAEYNDTDPFHEHSFLIDRARAALATPPPEPVDPSQISDGYHTFEELYEHRHALTLSLMKARPDLFWYSRRHNDGELCFGDGSWFILGAELPVAGGITYHLPMRLWDAATLTGATELKIGRHWDGHTATDVANRLMAWASTPMTSAPNFRPKSLSPEALEAWDAAEANIEASMQRVKKLTEDPHDSQNLRLLNEDFLLQLPNGDFLKSYPKVTRVELITSWGREVVKIGCSSVKVSLQDDGRTIKVFMNEQDQISEEENERRFRETMKFINDLKPGDIEKMMGPEFMEEFRRVSQ